jgi:hypothetical protein
VDDIGPCLSARGELRVCDRRWLHGPRVWHLAHPEVGFFLSFFCFILSFFSKFKIPIQIYILFELKLFKYPIKILR